MTNFFTACHDLNALKHEYRRLALLHHPDCGGTDDMMKTINAAYEIRFEQLKREHNAKADADTSGKVRATTETAREFMGIINALLKLDGLTIELCGCWLWISGDTKKHKDALKAAGCRWAAQKKMWSWHHAEDGSSFYRGKKSMTEIRSKYGSTTFSAAGTEELTTA